MTSLLLLLTLPPLISPTAAAPRHFLRLVSHHDDVQQTVVHRRARGARLHHGFTHHHRTTRQQSPNATHRDHLSLIRYWPTALVSRAVAGRKAISAFHSSCIRANDEEEDSQLIGAKGKRTHSRSSRGTNSWEEVCGGADTTALLYSAHTHTTATAATAHVRNKWFARRTAEQPSWALRLGCSATLSDA